jgi:hypothetical protein
MKKITLFLALLLASRKLELEEPGHKHHSLQTRPESQVKHNLPLYFPKEGS